MPDWWLSKPWTWKAAIHCSLLQLHRWASCISKMPFLDWMHRLGAEVTFEFAQLTIVRRSLRDVARLFDPIANGRFDVECCSEAALRLLRVGIIGSVFIAKRSFPLASALAAVLRPKMGMHALPYDGKGLLSLLQLSCRKGPIDLCNSSLPHSVPPPFSLRLVSL